MVQRIQKVPIHLDCDATFTLEFPAMDSSRTRRGSSCSRWPSIWPCSCGQSCCNGVYYMWPRVMEAGIILLPDNRI
uniref:Uncharacterized protein n=1 Tax=Magnetococcus massalia (strain MO-1) TaxID=451514 RepID=A0A1S7LM12_MAGMO|nr:protein of unknown function [Candidatus Magnetococcus massalia]